MLPESAHYTVQTPVYEGPLDLLLNLIEHAQLDITTLSLASVTDQFLQYLAGLEQLNADELSSFLVVASKLLQIKSEALLPRPPDRGPGEENPGESLVEQLKLYRRFRQVGQWLGLRQEAGLRTHIRVAPAPRIEKRLDLSNLSVSDLVAAAQRAFGREAAKEALGTVIAPPRITIIEKLRHINRTLNAIQRASFRSLLSKSPSRLEIVVTFLALLELVKQFRVAASQGSLFSDIEIVRAEGWSDSSDIELEFE